MITARLGRQHNNPLGRSKHGGLGDWVAWVGRYEDIVKGGEGQYRIRLMDNTKGNDCCYPGLEKLPDGTLVTTTYGHWTTGEQPYIVSVRLKLEELDAKAKAKR